MDVIRKTYLVTESVVPRTGHTMHRVYLNPEDMQENAWCLGDWAILTFTNVQVNLGVFTMRPIEIIGH
jgi:hypothetical protein